jgi:hypothetical protein
LPTTTAIARTRYQVEFASDAKGDTLVEVAVRREAVSLKITQPRLR